MRFGRAQGSRLPEELLDDNDLLMGGGLDQGAAEFWARNHPSAASDSAYRYLVDRLLTRFLAQRGSDAKAWTASGKFKQWIAIYVDFGTW